MIDRMYRTAIQNIQEEATATALATFEELITTRFSAAQQEALNDEAIAKISAQLTKKSRTYADKPKRLKTKRSAGG